MNTLQKVQSLVNDKIMQLTEADKKSVKTAKRAKYVSVGLAIDHHVKNIAKNAGAEIPVDIYAPYDFSLDQAVFDVKSYSSNSVSVSSNEFSYAYKRAEAEKDTHYIVFKQLQDDKFKYEGMVSFIELLKTRSFRTSQFQNGGVYFDPSLISKA